MEKNRPFQTDPSLKLMDRVTRALSYYRYARRTELSYTKWIREYIQFLSREKVTADRYHKEIDSFLVHLSDERKMSSSSCRQALNAVSFLYKRVFDFEVDVPVTPVKIRKNPVPPLTATPSEIRQILGLLKGRHLLMAQLLYGAGLRLMECTRLRVRHINFGLNLIYIYPQKKGRKRKVMIPERIREPLAAHVSALRIQHEKDAAAGRGNVRLPEIFTEKFKGEENQFSWQFVFPSKKISSDRTTGLKGRSHVLESGLQKAVQTAVKKAGIEKRISCSTFRHSFAVHLLQKNVDIRTVQKLMGHRDTKATQIYMQLLNKKDITRLSPLDSL